MKYIPGFKYAHSIGWTMNERYLEGKVKSIDMPYKWEGYDVTSCIIREFKQGYPNAVVANQFDDILDTGTAGVIFRAQ